MIEKIFLYVEGGGRGKETSAGLRRGFERFLGELREQAKSIGIALIIVPCGGRSEAQKYFREAGRRRDASAHHLLLIDSEGPHDLAACRDEQRHFMVQFMESWFIADVAALQGYYGRGFNPRLIPSGGNGDDVEGIAREEVLRGLIHATTPSTKGVYHKTHHPPELLKRIEPARVRARASHCDRLFRTLEQFISARRP